VSLPLTRFSRKLWKTQKNKKIKKNEEEFPPVFDATLPDFTGSKGTVAFLWWRGCDGGHGCADRFQLSPFERGGLVGPTEQLAGKCICGREVEQGLSPDLCEQKFAARLKELAEKCICGARN
jgi:hypothetical protein